MNYISLMNNNNNKKKHSNDGRLVLSEWHERLRHERACVDVKNTYKFHIIVVTLVRLEKVCHPSLQTATDEDAFVDVEQKDGPQGIDVTWRTERKTLAYLSNKIRRNCSGWNRDETRRETYSSVRPNPSRSNGQRPCRSGRTGWSLLPVSGGRPGLLLPSKTKRSCSAEENKTVPWPEQKPMT